MNLKKCMLIYVFIIIPIGLLKYLFKRVYKNIIYLINVIKFSKEYKLMKKEALKLVKKNIQLNSFIKKEKKK